MVQAKPFVRFTVRSLVRSGGDGRRRPRLRGRPTLIRLAGWWQVVEGGIPRHPGREVGARQVEPGHRGVGTAAGQGETAVGEPGGEFTHHLAGQLELGRAAFAVQPEVDW